MAGTIPLSLTQRFDKVTTKPLNGGKLYFYAAGTTTPQNAFQDSALAIPWPNPMTLDAGGNVPQLFFADGQIKVRLTNSAGVDQLTADNILVIGASSGGGGGGSVDPTTVMATGDMKIRYGTGLLTGFVRANGRTIGSATSGATERANADTQPLFEYLWGADANLVVSTGRGASANADWVANKTIALPDWRGRDMAFLDDMGNAAAGILTTARFGSDPTVLGNPGGVEATLLPLPALPNYAPGFTGLQQLLSFSSSGASFVNNPAAVGSSPGPWIVGQGSGPVTVSGLYTPNGTVGSINGGVTQASIPNTVPRRLATLYIKL